MRHRRHRSHRAAGVLVAGLFAPVAPLTADTLTWDGELGPNFSWSR